MAEINDETSRPFMANERTNSAGNGDNGKKKKMIIGGVVGVVVLVVVILIIVMATGGKPGPKPPPPNPHDPQNVQELNPMKADVKTVVSTNSAYSVVLDNSEVKPTPPKEI